MIAAKGKHDRAATELKRLRLRNRRTLTELLNDDERQQVREMRPEVEALGIQAAYERLLDAVSILSEIEDRDEDASSVEREVVLFLAAIFPMASRIATPRAGVIGPAGVPGASSGEMLKAGEIVSAARTFRERVASPVLAPAAELLERYGRVLQLLGGVDPGYLGPGGMSSGEFRRLKLASFNPLEFNPNAIRVAVHREQAVALDPWQSKFFQKLNPTVRRPKR